MELSIGHCPLVTPDGLLSCLRLQFLRHFEYVASLKVTKSFVLKIMSQNPSLESLAVNFDCEESEILAEINNNSRLTKLTKLVIIRCSSYYYSSNFSFQMLVGLFCWYCRTRPREILTLTIVLTKKANLKMSLITLITITSPTAID